MDVDPNNMIPTRRTLISRLRDWEDRDSWQEFFDTYWKLIYAVAIKSGLSDSEAEEVVQETTLSIAKKMPTFEYDPKKCSFKGWLKHVTRLRIIDQLRKRPPNHNSMNRPGNDSRQTGTIERIEDPNGIELESIWDDEWEHNLVDVAMERVKKQVNPEHYQMFYLSAVQGISPREVAKMLGKGVGQVYLIRHRVAKLVKKQKHLLESKKPNITSSEESGLGRN